VTTKSGWSTTGEGRCLLEVDRADERIGVAMHKLPVGAVSTIYLGHAQRPILVRQAPDLSVLPLDHHQHHGVAPDVRILQLQLRLAGLEVAGRSASPRRSGLLRTLTIRPWLLRQPGGLARTVRVGKGFDADDPPIAQSQER
jgi:hypothetical protein